MRGSDTVLPYYQVDNDLYVVISFSLDGSSGYDKKETMLLCTDNADRRGNLTTVSGGEEQLKAFTFDVANRMRSAYEIKDGIAKRVKSEKYTILMNLVLTLIVI